MHWRIWTASRSAYCSRRGTDVRLAREAYDDCMEQTMAAASLADWFDINNVFIRYATSLDHGDVESVVDCFAENASVVSPVLGEFFGHSGVRDFAMRTARLKQEEGVQFRHVVSNLVVDIEGDRARANCYLLDFRTRDGKTELLSP